MSRIPSSAEPAALQEALSQLCSLDPVIAHLRQRHGIPTINRRSLVDFNVSEDSSMEVPIEISLFSDLVDIVIHQQLAGRAAVAISSRVKKLLGEPLTPKNVLMADPQLLRATGLSGAKLIAITGVAQWAEDGQLPLSNFASMSDEEVMAHLCTIRGIGPWSVEMFLMFSLGRMDIWPCGDLGVRKGFRHSFGLEAVPTAKELNALGERFRPYRSLVAWYMWRSLSDPSPALK